MPEVSIDPQQSDFLKFAAHRVKYMSSVAAVKIWIWLSVFATSAGWILSACGQLRPLGYVLSAGVAGVLWVVMQRAFPGDSCPAVSPRRAPKWRRRFTRRLPLMFAGLAVLVFVGGLIYAPSNHTGLSYRIPRVLHWLEAGRWHWIETPNFRMNNRACGIEWLSAPFLLFLKSDRALFLLNFIPFLLLPGLLFSLLRRLGIRGRVAWSWMWIFPSGYVFLLQAGSAGNDAFPVVYAIAAVDFACRAWASRRANDLWYSALAIALLTGAKASNLPLCLTWLVAVGPLWRLLKDRLLLTGLVATVAVVVSFLPTAALNIANCGTWSGLQLERRGIEMKNPLVGLWGNPVVLAVNNFCPPIFPMAKWWNAHALEFVPSLIREPLERNFEAGFHEVLEIPTEDWAGLGPGLSILMLFAAGFAVPGYLRGGPELGKRTALPPRILKLVLLSPWIALAAYCLKSGMVTPGRLIAPYYPLLLPALLVGAAQLKLVQQRWWRWLVNLVFLTAAMVLILAPARPLWPALTVLQKAAAAKPGNRLINRALGSYAVYRIRPDPLAALRPHLPTDIKTIGYLGTEDDLDISLWKPYGQRAVIQIRMEDTAEQIRARKMTYAVVSGFHFFQEHALLADWLRQTRAEIVAEVTATVTLRMGEQHWYLVRFNP